MAKKENTRDVTGGLTTGLDFNAETNEEVKEERDHTTPRTGAQKRDTPLLAEYKKRVAPERRSVKLNISIKPSMSEKLEHAKNTGEIRSFNDLINFLLEQYFSEQEKLRS